MLIIILYYLICISILISIIKSNHASDKVISFFIFVILTTLYVCYLDTKFIAFSILLWYGRRISAIFVILSQYTSARKLNYFIIDNKDTILWKFDDNFRKFYIFFPIFLIIVFFFKDYNRYIINYINSIFNDFIYDAFINDY